MNTYSLATGYYWAKWDERGEWFIIEIEPGLNLVDFSDMPPIIDPNPIRRTSDNTHKEYK